MDASSNPSVTPAAKKKVLFGVSGSVATIKMQEIAHNLVSRYEVKIVTTTAARHFFSDGAVSMALGVTILKDADEWTAWGGRGDPVLHIELRKWADIFILAPLSANTLAKISNGVADNLLTSVARAWDWHKPFLVAPAMNTAMWEHPITEEQLQKVQKWGIKIIPPISKTLMCGDAGTGAMAEPAIICTEVIKALTSSSL